MFYLFDRISLWDVSDAVLRVCETQSTSVIGDCCRTDHFLLFLLFSLFNGSLSLQHLLLMLRAVYRVDQPTAVDELRAFFDYSVSYSWLS